MLNLFQAVKTRARPAAVPVSRPTLPQTHADDLYQACPERGDALDRWYEQPAMALLCWLGPIALDAEAGDDERHRRIDWQLRMAAETLSALAGVSVREWAPLHGDASMQWYRAAYWRALFAGLGRLYVRHEVFVDGGLVDWLHKPITPRQTVSLAYRDRPIDIDPVLAEFALSQRVLPEIVVADLLDARVWLAYLDSWSRQPSERNPITRALIIAETKMAELTVRAGHRRQVAVEAPPRASAPVPVSTAMPSLSPTSDSPSATEIASTERKSQAPIESAQAPMAAGTPEPVGITPAYVAFLQRLSQALADGQITANQKGALIHGTELGPGLVSPAVFDWCSEQGEPNAQGLYAALDAAGLIDDIASQRTHFFEIKGKGSKPGRPRVNLVVLRGGLVRSWLSVPVNGELRHE